MEKETLNAAAFFVFDEAGKLTAGGVVEFKRLSGAVAINIKIFKDEFAARMYETLPRGGYTIVDDFTGGRLKLLTGEMDGDIPYQSITSLVDSLRERFELPLVKGGAKVKGVFMKPNPAKS